MLLSEKLLPLLQFARKDSIIRVNRKFREKISQAQLSELAKQAGHDGARWHADKPDFIRLFK